MDQSSKPSGSADSYIGSFISLTSKAEVRYEGVLHRIDTEKSTIELQNVRSYGTEGRRKDGAQIPPMNDVFEYILFRGRDIKDLQVKSSPPVHTKQHILDDPAIIQSHYAQSSSASHTVSGALTEPSFNGEPSALSAPVNPGTLPSHQYRAHLEPRGSLATQNVDGEYLAMPINWNGYYASLSNQPHVQQQPLPFQPPSTIPTPLTLQNQLQYHEVQASESTNMVNLAGHVTLVPPPIDRTSNSFPSNFSNSPTPIQVSVSRESLPSNRTPVTADSLTVSSLPSYNQDPNATIRSFSAKSEPAPISGLYIQSFPYSASSIVGSTSGPLLTIPPTLLTPDQLIKPGSLEPSSTQLYTEHKNMEAPVPTSSKLLASASASSTPLQGSLLPLPHTSQEFTEEFDFVAMNEKFKKDEVWGYLGKEKCRNSVDHPIDQNKDGDYGKAPEFGAKPVYVKDEFFDTLSCNSLNRGGWNGRGMFSERRKLDTQTFGDFNQRPHMNHGGRGSGHRGNYRGSYNRGRGYNVGGRGGSGGYMPT